MLDTSPGNIASMKSLVSLALRWGRPCGKHAEQDRNHMEIGQHGRSKGKRDQWFQTIREDRRYERGKVNDIKSVGMRNMHPSLEHFMSELWSDVDSNPLENPAYQSTHPNCY